MDNVFFKEVSCTQNREKILDFFLENLPPFFFMLIDFFHFLLA